MKILGMETSVGPKPGALTPRIFTEFNQVFLEIYLELENKKVFEYQAQNYESKGVFRHGDIHAHLSSIVGSSVSYFTFSILLSFHSDI
jgi:hypothetical protein